MASSGDGFKMDHAYVAGLGQQWGNMPNALGQLHDYAAFNGGSPGDGLQAQHFGGTPNAQGAAAAFLGLMQSLDASVGKAKDYADAIAKAFTATARTTSERDAENAFDVNQSGQGA
jgi:hypothetical protein